MSRLAKLVRLDPNGVDSNGEQQQVLLEQTAHLGRSNERVAHTERLENEQLTRAKVSLLVEGKDDFISRNHALIDAPEYDGGSFHLTDLNSANGTYLNGWQLKPDQRVQLQAGDIIGLSSEAQFEFSLVKPALNMNHALMIGHTGGNLRGPHNDVRLLRGELEKRGFDGNIEIMLDREAGRSVILEALNRLSRVSTKDSVFMFYFSGHGSENGDLCLSTNQVRPGRRVQLLGPNEGTLKPNELLGALSQFRSKVLMVLDGCHTEAVVSAGLPPRTTIVGHRGQAYEGQVDTAMAREADQMGYTTRAIVNALRSDEHRMSIERIINHVKSDPRVYYHQEVRAAVHTDIVFPTQAMSLEEARMYIAS